MTEPLSEQISKFSRPLPSNKSLEKIYYYYYYFSMIIDKKNKTISDKEDNNENNDINELIMLIHTY